MLVAIRRLGLGQLAPTVPRYVESLAVDGRPGARLDGGPGHADERRLPPLGAHRPPQRSCSTTSTRRSAGCGQFQRTTARAAAPARLAGPGARRASAAAGTGTRRCRRRSVRLETAGRRLAGARLPATAVHGDFWFGNLLVARRRGQRGRRLGGRRRAGLAAARRRPVRAQLQPLPRPAHPPRPPGARPPPASAAPGSRPASATPCAATAGSRGSSAARSSRRLDRARRRPRPLVRRRAHRRRRGRGVGQRRRVRRRPPRAARRAARTAPAGTGRTDADDQHARRDHSRPAAPRPRGRDRRARRCSSGSPSPCSRSWSRPARATPRSPTSAMAGSHRWSPCCGWRASGSRSRSPTPPASHCWWSAARSPRRSPSPRWAPPWCWSRTCSCCCGPRPWRSGRYDPAILAAATVTWCRVAVVYSAVVLVAYLIGFGPLSGVTAKDGVRASYTFGDPNLAGNYLVIVAVHDGGLPAPARRLAPGGSATCVVLVAIGFTGSNGADADAADRSAMLPAPRSQYRRRGPLAGPALADRRSMVLAAVLALIVMPARRTSTPSASRPPAASRCCATRSAAAGRRPASARTILDEGKDLFLEGNATGVRSGAHEGDAAGQPGAVRQGGAQRLPGDAARARPHRRARPAAAAAPPIAGRCWRLVNGTAAASRTPRWSPGPGCWSRSRPVMVVAAGVLRGAALPAPVDLARASSPRWCWSCRTQRRADGDDEPS